MKRSPINKLSKKRKASMVTYKKVRKEYMIEHNDCEVCFGNKATEIHHKRGRIAKFLCDKTYFLALCPSCHREITDNPKWAMEKGYSLDRLAR